MNEQCYYRVSIKGIVINEQGDVLLARRDNGKWELLGGGLDHGEEIEACLRREIAEEAGLKITSISKMPHFVFSFKPPGKTTFRVNLVYKMTLEHLNFVPSSECLELKFFTVNEMRDLNSYGNVQKLAALMIN